MDHALDPACDQLRVVSSLDALRHPRDDNVSGRAYELMRIGIRT
jgi:hypothetical protein